MRRILFREERSGLAARCALLDDRAPRSCDFLRSLAEARGSFEAIHAMWTGPELSCPLPASVLPAHLADMTIPEENATSHPACGEIALACVPAGSLKDLPPGNFFDIGIFYGDGARLLFPFGWLRANVCARILEEDLAAARAAIAAIRRNGACRLDILAGD